MRTVLSEKQISVDPEMDRLRNERDYRSETLPGNSLRPQVTTIRCYARPYQLQD